VGFEAKKILKGIDHFWGKGLRKKKTEIFGNGEGSEKIVSHLVKDFG